ncbi:formylglycine-generating enzyme family protein [Nesterenkonia sp. Act20]|uniref:formylglycine-generating enzyme family protein n=1 Tax=Nesterenkonia sp. Act20 TaxID=1483432 RepID=UPI001C469FA3|nr:formylglycine-generating enzyme family protein [Nesterenkonia sp. Act20]
MNRSEMGAVAESCCGPSRATPSKQRSQPTTTPASSASDSATKAAVVAELAASATEELQLIGLGAAKFQMGSEDALAYPADGEGPVRTVRVASFAISATAVTVAEFARFVQATGHVTDAEKYGDSLVFQGLLPPRLRDRMPAPVASTPWWRQVPGACWFAPEGSGSTARGREDHPVTQVSQRDAQAYADWVGARLPTEEEWEYASRGGLDQQPYPWGDVRDPEGQRRMNIFPGEFPEGVPGEVGTKPVTSFKPNGFGLYNTTGNVWEWTASTFSSGSYASPAASGTTDSTGAAADPVMRGGSYMCHSSYCRRYRTSARTSASADSSLGHTGFRLAFTPASPG